MIGANISEESLRNRPLKSLVLKILNSIGLREGIRMNQDSWNKAFGKLQIFEHRL